MATISYTQSKPISGEADFMLITWAGLANGDDGQPFMLAQFADRSVQVEGTFGTGGTLVVQGTIDNTNYRTLNDPYSNAISITTPKIEAVSELVNGIRPKVTSGDGTTSLTVSMLVRKSK